MSVSFFVPVPVSRTVSGIRAGMGLAVLVFPLACRASPEIPETFAADVLAFRAEAEAEIAGPDGPLSTVAGHYVEPGHTVGLFVGEAGVMLALDEEVTSAPLRLVVAESGIECTKGCGEGAVAIDASRHVMLAPFRIGLSPQSGGLRVLVHDPRAPGLAAFAGLSWYDPDPRFFRLATLKPTPEATPEPLATTRGLVKPMRPVGTLELSLPGGEDVALVAYEAGPDALLVPFTDATNGTTTYDVGRYLTVERPSSSPPDRRIVDFNRATNPWCAYSEHYNCPIPPAENRIPAAIEAGERHEH